MYSYIKKGLKLGFALFLGLAMTACNSDADTMDTEEAEQVIVPITIGMDGQTVYDVQTVSEAKSMVRDLLAQEGTYSEIVVTVPAGTYSPEDFRFDENDCSENTKVIWVGEEGAEISAGLSIPQKFWTDPDSTFAERFYEEALPNIRMISLTDFGLTAEDWGTEIYIGKFCDTQNAPTSGAGTSFATGKKGMIKARFPNEGEWLRASQTNEGLWLKGSSVSVVSSWSDLTDVWVYGGIAYDWADMSSPVVSIEKGTSGRVISLLDAPSGGWKKSDTRSSFYFYNIADELDSEGEWYLDRETGNLYFWPWEGATTADFTYRADTLIHCQNTVNMTFDGFTLRCTQDKAIYTNGRLMTFQNLDISEIYAGAVVIDGSDNRITDCELSDLSSGGVVLYGGNRATLTHGNNRAEYLYIHDTAKLNMMYHPGVEINGVGNTVAHCELRNMPHSAILYKGNEHTIEYNDIRNVVQFSKDAGAIYAGRSWTDHGTVIRYNLLVDIGNSKFQSDGIYLDDGLTGQTVYGNILVNVAKTALMVGGGRENVIENNIVVNSNQAALLYDDRNRDGYINHGWAYHHVLPHGSAAMWQTLDEVPYTEGIWAEKYPLLAQMKTAADTDVDDPDHPINPSYSVVKNNVLIAPNGAMFSVARSVYTFSKIQNFAQYATAEEAGWNAETFTLSPDSRVYTALPAFTEIPVDKIGRVK